MRWRSWGVSTSRCERLVVNLTDIGGEFLLSNCRGLRCGNPARRDYNSIKQQRRMRSHAKFFAQIKSSNLSVFCQVARCAGAKYFSVRHYVRPIRHAKCLAHIMIRHENPNATIAQVKDDILNIIDCFWINSGKWFVKQNELRLSRQRARDFGAATLTTRERFSARVAHLLDAELLQQLFDTLQLFTPAQSHRF